MIRFMFDESKKKWYYVMDIKKYFKLKIHNIRKYVLKKNFKYATELPNKLVYNDDDNKRINSYPKYNTVLVDINGLIYLICNLSKPKNTLFPFVLKSMRELIAVKPDIKLKSLLNFSQEECMSKNVNLGLSNEEICRCMFERITHTKVKKVKFCKIKNFYENLLKYCNDDNIRHNYAKIKLLELDGYCEKYKIAFEYDGPHHFHQGYYDSSNNPIKSFEDQQERDFHKKIVCKYLGIKLYNFDYRHDLTETFKQIKPSIEYIVKSYDNLVDMDTLCSKFKTSFQPYLNPYFDFHSNFHSNNTRLRGF